MPKRTRRRRRRRHIVLVLRARWRDGPCWDSDDIPYPDDDTPDFPWDP